MIDSIVIDTSALISALIGSQGPSREILRQCLQGTYNPLVSNALFLEYEDVSKREKISLLVNITKKLKKAMLLLGLGSYFL